MSSSNEPAGRPHRPPQAGNAVPRIGIDFGGTKIAGIVLDERGLTLAEDQVATPRNDYAGSIEAVARMIEKLDVAAGLRATVGIGIPGSISPATGHVQNGNSVWLNGRPMRTDLERRLGREVRVANDADCFALSEAHDGAASGARTVFGVILGTGCGGGLVVGGTLVTGPHHTGGEWGHIPLPWASEEEFRSAPVCWCGRRSCMEVWVSGPAMEADHLKATGKKLASRKIVAEAEAGDPAARATLDRHADRLARGLSALVNVIDPDVFVLGGGLSTMEHLYRVLPGLMARWVFADTTNVTIRPPVHGPASGVRGAARLWN